MELDLAGNKRWERAKGKKGREEGDPIIDTPLIHVRGCFTQERDREKACLLFFLGFSFFQCRIVTYNSVRKSQKRKKKNSRGESLPNGLSSSPVPRPASQKWWWTQNFVRIISRNNHWRGGVEVMEFGGGNGGV